MPRKILLIPALLAAALALSGCKSAKERAAEHFAAAKALIQKGDAARATVEFRNVFKLDPQNRDARMAYGQMLAAHGNLASAYAQYQQVAEQYPKDIDAIRAAARAAARISDWKDAAAQVQAGLALVPQDPELLQVKAAADYAAAVTADDQAAWMAAADRAQNLLDKHPGDLLLRRVVIDSLMRQHNYDAADAEIDTAIGLAPKDKSLYGLKLSVLAARKDNAGIETELKRMVALFPDDPQMGATLVRWYETHHQLDAAEAYLRKTAADAPDDPQPKLALVSFLAKYRGPIVALSELDKIIAALPTETSGAKPGTTTVRTFRALRATIEFGQEKRAQAVTEMKAVLKDAPQSDETRRIQVALAKMEAQMGDMVSARALVEDVLKQDKGQLDAIKLKAGWLIQGDSPDDAITILRDALNAHPNDVQVMSLMAEAYQRAGNHQLMGAMLSQAAQASNYAPMESLRYATYLAQEKKYLPAESVLVDALRLDPRNIAILAPLGRLYVQMKDWPRASQVADRLDEIGGTTAKRAADGLRPAILAGQKNMAAAVGYLQGLAQQGGSTGRAADITLLRAYLAQGDGAKAEAFAQKLLSQNPTDPELRFLAATVQAATGQRTQAEKTYRDLIQQDPKRLPVWLALIGQLNASGDAKVARAALDDGLKALPDAPDLLAMRAGYLEQDGNIDGAIKIYAQLYQKNSNNVILANNLASLLSSYHAKDPASVERAYNIARRLRGTKVPAFEDTYGWITYLRGNVQEALSYLEPAAAGLPKNALAQYHLGEAYRAMNEPKKARAQYAKVVALVPKDDNSSYVVAARKWLTTTPVPDSVKGD